MYGLPENVDLNFLKAKRLIQICISAHQIIFGFDEDISISIESPIKLISGIGESYLYDDVSSINKDFIGLLESSVVDVIPYVTGTLVLLFSSGSKIELVDDSIQYESYQIFRGGKIVVVV